MIIIPKTDFATQFTTEPTTSDTFCIKYQGEWVKYNSDSDDFSLTSNPNEASVFQYGGSYKTLIVDSTKRMCIVTGTATPASGWYNFTTQTGSGYYNVRVASFTSSDITINLGSYSTTNIRGYLNNFRIEDGKLQGYLIPGTTTQTYTLAFTFYDSTSLATLPIQYKPHGIGAVIIDGNLYYGSWPTPPVIQAKLYGGQWFSDNYIRLNSNIKHVVFANTANVPTTNIVDVTSNFTEGVNYDGPVHFAEWTDPNDNTTITVYVHANSTIYMQNNEWTYGKYGVRELFDDCSNLVTIAFNNLDISACTDARSMFYGCYALTTVSGTWDTSNLESMYGMFNKCSLLTSFPNIVAGNNCTTMTNMFSQCFNLVDASNITFPTVAPSCGSMFYQCTSLTTPPALTSTTLSFQCYSNMFNGSGLVTPPALPATTLNYGCYEGMFAYCTHLTSVPTLSATNLADACYRRMFAGCTSLVTPPALPATTLMTACYQGMFDGCQSLTSTPTLSVTNLTSSCYRGMFKNCLSLTTVPNLPATTLSEYCYYEMFSGCALLNTLPLLRTPNEYPQYCYSRMFYDCGSIYVATTQDSTYTNAYTVPNASVTGADPFTDMFVGTSGTFAGTPTINTTYYTSNTIISA